MIGPMGVSAEEVRYRGRSGIALEAEGVSAVFLPDAGMTGVSLRFGGSERLSLPGGVPRVEGGGTAGLPLLAPWANRLASRRFRSGGTEVDLRDAPVRTDDNGLPIHGLLLGSPRWQVTELAQRGSTARLGASIAVDEPSFPFAHRIDLLVTARERALVVDISVTPTGHRPVPIAFGWHPYLRLPDVPRSQWRLRLPRRRHLVLDRLGLPTGDEVDEPAEDEPIGRRRFDDLYALGRDRRLAFVGDDQEIELHCGAGYPYAQVWVPAGRTYAALEPMAAPTNALVAGTAPVVEPGDTYTARFTLSGR
jgi:aldose 1-epimerase